MGRLLASNSGGQPESYCEHIVRCLEEFNKLKSRFYPTFLRVFPTSEERVELAIRGMLVLHDAGKLLGRWQREIQKESDSLPPHAAVSAAVLDHYLCEIVDDSLRKAAVFAVAIHHIDRGTIGQNLDEPDVQAVRSGLVSGDGRLLWHVDAQAELGEVAGRIATGFEPPRLADVGLETLRCMASDLRKWARGPSLRTMHQRRLQGSLMHHLLRVCDVRAASRRPSGVGSVPVKESEFSKLFLEGGLL